MTRAAWAVIGLALGGCATVRDSFSAAERSLVAQDLPGALVALDAVPVSHPRYPEARAAALSVERSMRRVHELLLEALVLRGEWRDDEAVVTLRRARAIWPKMPGIDAMISATENRGRLLRAGRPDAAQVAHVAEVPRPVSDSEVSSAPPTAAPLTGEPPEEAPVALLPPAPALATPAPAAPVPLVETVEPRGPAPTSPDENTTTTTEGPPSVAGPDAVATGLVAVEARLGRGDLGAAVAELIELSRRFADDPRVRLRLASVLHQRALQRYGHGQLASAIVDWERVIVLDPSNEVARSLLAAARAEAAIDTRSR